jgi:hypothetical protein
MAGQAAAPRMMRRAELLEVEIPHLFLRLKAIMAV